MKIKLNKFGTTLTSRQLGREAQAAFLPSLKTISNDEKIIIDFDGVNTFTPSWGDEFLSPLLKKFGERLVLKKTDNLSVIETIALLEEIYKYKFKYLKEKLG